MLTPEVPQPEGVMTWLLSWVWRKQRATPEQEEVKKLRNMLLQVLPEVELLKAQVEDLKVQLNVQGGTLEETRQELEETRQELGETRQELKDTRQELDETSQELEKTRQELKQVKVKAETDRAAWTAQIESLIKELEIERSDNESFWVSMGKTALIKFTEKLHHGQ
eukprot:jgi/Tetstr1/442108/TSEL_030265.t1